MTGSAVPTTPYDAIEACLGAAARTYAENKHRGGSNGKKGCRYEDFFVAAKAAEIAARCFYAENPEWPHLRGQVIGFVDDTVVSSSADTEYFQLKNVEGLSWTAGKHPLETDFASQYKLSKHLNEPNPTTTLVVADADLQKSMLETIPKNIKEHSTVVLFPFYNGHFNRLVVENQEVQDSLRRIAKVENPSLDELSGVFGVLVLACIEHPDGCTVDELVKYANRYYPSQIRTLAETDDGSKFLRGDFVNALADIKGLKYDVKRGYFTWSAFGTSGVFGSDCSTDEFRQFQEHVVQQQPKTFDHFEVLLP